MLVSPSGINGFIFDILEAISANEQITILLLSKLFIATDLIKNFKQENAENPLKKNASRKPKREKKRRH